GLAVAVEVLSAFCMPRRAKIGTDIGIAQERQSVHQPNRSLTGRIALPQDVGLAIAVEIADALDMPFITHAAWSAEADPGRSVHQPDRGLTAVVLKKDVGFAVAVEIPGALGVPGGIGRADIGAGENVRAVYQPDGCLTAVVLKEDIGVAVAVEVVGDF